MNAADAAQCLAWCRGQVWAAEPTWLQSVTDSLLAAQRGDGRAIEAARSPAPGRQRRQEAPDMIAIIPVTGAISYHDNLFLRLFGGTSIKALLAELKAAMNDSRVKSILMPVASPGGTAEGLLEIAKAMRAARERKPIVAAVDALSASAAYWITAQASEITITDSGEAGSVGVYSMHVSLERALKREGLDVTYVASTPEKVEGNPAERLSDPARAEMQRRVDRVYADFLNDVARGRRRDRAEVEALWGKGRLLEAQRARRRGLVDKIESFDDTLARVIGSAPRPRASLGDQLGQLLAGGCNGS